MSKLVSEFKALPLATYDSAKDLRRVELETETRQLGSRPGEGNRKSDRAAKYRGSNGETWSGTGAIASWLKNL